MLLKIPTISDNGATRRRLDICALIAVHLLLAISPFAVAFLPSRIDVRPVEWSLFAIPYSQFMLLSLWIGMMDGKTVLKVLPAILAVLYLTVCLSSSFDLIGQIVSPWIFYNITLLCLMTLVAAYLSRLLGTVHYQADLTSAEVVFSARFSLSTLLVLSTIIALVLGSMRLSINCMGNEDILVALGQLPLLTVVFSISLAANVWVTLGAELNSLRTFGGFAIVLLLGFCLSVGIDPTPISDYAFTFVGLAWMVIIPTAIVTLSLLYLRKLGFRLIPPAKLSISEGMTSVWDEPST